MDLLIDIGNSRIKASYYNQTLSPMLIYDHFDELLIAINQNKPQKIWISSVRNQQKNQDLGQKIIQNCQINPCFLSTRKQQLGVLNGYFDYTKLGVDRWLAMLAAWTQYHTAVCVVDCGSAVTIDVLDQKGIHQGGLILPGLSLMQESLLKQTDLDFKQQPIFSPLAKKTDVGIYSGCLQAIIAIIERVKQLNSVDTIILCGGDAVTVAAGLKTAPIIIPDLVLQGIQSIIAENKP